MSRCEVGLSVFAEGDVARREKAIPTEDFLRVGVPNDELIVGMFANVKFIEV